MTSRQAKNGLNGPPGNDSATRKCMKHSNDFHGAILNAKKNTSIQGSPITYGIVLEIPKASSIQGRRKFPSPEKLAPFVERKKRGIVFVEKISQSGIFFVWPHSHCNPNSSARVQPPSVKKKEEKKLVGCASCEDSPTQCDHLVCKNSLCPVLPVQLRRPVSGVLCIC